MTKVILHAGQHKTGTTAIQKHCAENRETLLRLGYLYPASGMGNGGNHGALIKSILGQPLPPNRRDGAERLAAEVAAHPGATLVVSAEFLDSQLLTPPRDNRVISFFRALGAEMQVIMYLRPEPQKLNSSYVQQVKNFNTGLPFAQFASSHAAKSERRYRRLAELAGSDDLQANLVPYDESLRRSGVVRDFLSRIGLSESQIAAMGPERRVNESIGPIAVAVALHTLARAEESGPELSDRQRRRLKPLLFELIAAEPPEPRFQGWDGDLLTEILPVLADGREAFAQKAWAKSWDDVFGTERERASNVFDLETATEAEREQFFRMRETMWDKAQEVLANGRLAKARPWDRSELRGRRQQA